MPIEPETSQSSPLSCGLLETLTDLIAQLGRGQRPEAVHAALPAICAVTGAEGAQVVHYRSPSGCAVIAAHNLPWELDEPRCGAGSPSRFWQVPLPGAEGIPLGSLRLLRPFRAPHPSETEQAAARLIAECLGLALQQPSLFEDPLTGLPTRKKLEDELKAFCARAPLTGERAAVVMLDLDHFKSVNDALGRAVGDELLQGLVTRLRRRLPHGTILARVGGDKFGILLAGAGLEEATRLARQLLQAVAAEPLQAQGRSVHLRLKAGVSLYPAHALNAERLLALADIAVARAKEWGGDGIAVADADPAWHATVSDAFAREQELRQVLREGRLLLYWQPILSLHEERVTHHEILLRIRDGAGRIVAPSSFLEIAERSALINEIDRWVVQRAIELLTSPAQRDRGLTLSVNLSARAFSDNSVIRLLQDGVRAAGLNPHSLVLEVTETAAVQNVTEAEAFMRALRDMGFRFALDDFGVGFSSLYILKSLPVDYLKIDGRFIRNLSQDRTDQQLVKAIAQLARDLGKATVAEFVSSPADLELLRTFGVDYAQGYLIGEPEPVLDPGGKQP